MQLKTVNPLKEALKCGQSLWYDGLLSPAEFKRMIEDDGVRGATTNPAIFEKAIISGVYDAQFQELLPKFSNDDVYKVIAIQTVQQVCDAFLPVYESSKGQDGYVSIEVSPLLAYDTAGTIREAKELYERIARRNVMIKIPATRQGLAAITAVIAEGISVNVTLIFSVERHREVMDAYLSGLEQRVIADKEISNIASVASFFVSRVDSAVDKILEDKTKAGSAFENLLGKAAIANSKAAYDAYEQIFSSDRFVKLKSKGANVQRPLWASTGTKNPKYSDVLYVETLIGRNTVNTMPPATVDAFRDHGQARPDTIKENISAAYKDLEALKSAGIDLNKVTQDLEDNGVTLFSDSYKKIMSSIGAKRK